MSEELNLVQKNEQLYLPQAAEILEIKSFAQKEKWFLLKILSGKSLGNVPGQFVELSLMGIGEAPISITSAPRDDDTFELAVRAVGDVTNNLHQKKVGDIIHFRGPFGHGFDDKIMADLKGKHLLFVVGGIGYFPVRSLINKVLPASQDYKKVSILYGCKTPQERMYQDELAKIATMGGNIELIETVDKADEDWKGNVGVITTIIPKANFNPEETVAIIVGPPIMYKFVLKTLAEFKVPKKNIYMSLERRMKCGVGKCGHCQMAGVYVCQEGPVFNYADVANNEEVF